MQFKPFGIIYILLDRIDKCREEGRTALLEVLGRVGVAYDSSCTLKVLVVNSGSDWTFDHRKEIANSYRRNRRFFRQYVVVQEREDGYFYSCDIIIYGPDHTRKIWQARTM